MKLNKIFLSMAALVFVGAMTAGCSGDDLTAETPQLPDTTNGTVVTKVTVSLDEHASTRALTEAGVKTFEAGDKIAVIYKNKAGETVKAESVALNSFDILSSNSAKFSVTLTNPQANTPVRYIYPAAMAVATIAIDAAIDDATTIDYTKLATQDGTLTKLGSNFDLAVFDGTMTAQAVLPAATLENPLTIGKFTIKNSGGTDITNTITKLTIADGTNTYTVSPSTLSNIYVAMKPISKTQTVTIKAITADNKFIKSVTGNTLAKNTMYPINVSMTARYPFAATDTKLSSEDIGSVIGADGKIYLNAAAATAATTTAQAVIAYVGSVLNYFDKFLAIAMTDVNGTHTWPDAHTAVGTFAGSHGITIGSTEYKTNAIGATYYDQVANNPDIPSATRDAGVVKGWRLPSVTDWRYIFDGLGRQKAGLTLTNKKDDGSIVYCNNVTPTDPLGVVNGRYYYKDGDADGASSLRAAINAACGNEDLQSGDYWSSSEYDDMDRNKAWYYRFYYGKFSWTNRTTYDCYARAVFAY